MLGEHFGKPVTMTARGSDVNVFPQYSWPRRMILWAIARATATITVSQSLKASLAELGVPSQGILVLRNGVDLDAFKPKDPAPLLAKFSLRPPVLLSVGNLLAAKGHELVIRALLEVPDATLLIVGSGPDELRLRQIMDSLGLAQRVRFLGAVDHDALVDIYNVADVMVLASAREGLPNVLLESLACGTPVAATDVSGIPEIVTSPVAGRLFPNRTPGAVAETIRYLLANPVDRAQTRSFAEKFSWDETTRGQIDLFREILSSNQPHRPGPRTTS